MRWIVLIVIGLFATGWLACQWEVAPEAEAPASATPVWVRTVDGWQRASDLAPPAQVYAPPLHPLVVGLGQLLIALLALLLFPAKKPGLPAHGPQPIAPSHSRRQMSETLTVG